MKNTVRFLAQTFDHSRIASAQATFDTDLSGRTLDVDSARVSLSTEDRRRPRLFFTAEPLPFFTRDGLRFNTAKDGEETPVIGAWSQANPLQLLRGGSLFKTFFPSMLRRVSPFRTEITLMSALGLLAQRSHRGGVYTGTVTAGDLIREICGSVSVYVSPVFEDVKLYGFLPYVTPTGVPGSQRGSAKDNLLQVLFALNASVRAGADGTLRVENLPTATASVLDRSRIYRDGAAVEELPPVTSVTVLEHSYGVGTESKELFTGVTTAGQVIIFSEPCSDLTATGFTVMESGANYAIVSAGSGTLTGVPYVHTTREITRTVAQSLTENVVRVENATLVGITNSADVANRLAAYYACRKYINCDAVIEFENPGDVVSIWDNVAKQMRQACLEAISPLTFSNTLKGRVRALVGFTPWQTIPFTDEHVILTASGTYTFPSDIAGDTEVTVIVIGGGDGGTNGGNGANGTAYPKSGVFTPPGSLSTGAGAGGQGGAAGVHGNGGKILRAALIVNPGQQVQVTIGAGGAANGGSGGNTVFGSISSATGASSDAGYYDPVSGTTYGISGTDGVAGGNGGNGGSAGSDGQAGGNVGTNTGGRGGKGYKYTGWLSKTTENIGGAGGGGAAYGANGGAGFDPPASSYGQAQPGGAGGSAAAAAAAVHYGDGGSGGNGGGGGGGGGAWSFNDPDSGSTTSYYYNSVGGSGGRGSAGSAGRQGCVILIFRKPAQNND